MKGFKSLLRAVVFLSLLHATQQCQVPTAPTTVSVATDWQGDDGSFVKISVSNPPPADFDHFEINIKDFEEQVQVYANEHVELGTDVSVDLPKFGTVYEIFVHTVVNCTNGTFLKSEDFYEEKFVTEPPKIETEVEVIFMNESLLCIVWIAPKDDAHYDEIETTLMQPLGTSLDTKAKNVEENQDAGFECFHSSALERSQVFSVKLTSKVSYDNLQLFSNSPPGHRNFQFQQSELGVSVDISHCDADTCLVNIRASQLPNKEKFDFTYQVFEYDTENVKVSGRFRGSYCSAEQDSCTYLVENLEPNTKYEIELTPSIFNDELPFPTYDDFRTPSAMADPSDPIKVECELIDGQAECTIVLSAEDDKMMDRYSFQIRYVIINLGVVGANETGTVNGKECSGNIGSCSFDLNLQLAEGEYELMIRIEFDDEEVATIQRTNQFVVSVPSDDSVISMTILVILVVVAGVIIALFLFVVVVLCLRKQKQNANDWNHRELGKFNDNTYVKPAQPDIEYEPPDNKWKSTEDEPYAEYKVKEGVELAAYVNPDLKSDADSIYENEAYEEMDKKVEDNSDDDGCLPSKSNEYLEPEIKGQKNEPASQPNEYLIPIAQEDYDDVENLKKNEKEDGQDEEEEEGRKPSVRNEYITPARN